MGIEGVVASGQLAATRVTAEWLKVRFRESLVGVIGAVVGPITAPEALIVGEVDAAGALKCSAARRVCRPPRRQ